MARVPASTPGRGVTTYKSGKTSTTSRHPGSTLKKKIVNPSPMAKHTKVTSVVERGRAIAEANSDSDSDDTGSSDGSRSEEKENDEGDAGEEEEFDPNLKHLVHQSGLKGAQFKVRPPKETPTTSRTLVNRSRPSVYGIQGSKVQRTESKTPHYTEDQGGDQESRTSSDDTEDDGNDQREHVKALPTRNKSRTALDVARGGKENVQVKSKTSAYAEERDQGRKFGKVVQAPAERQQASRKKPYDASSRHPRQTSKTRAQLDPQPAYANPIAPHKSARTYDMPSSETGDAECTNDQQIFGLQGDQNDRVVKDHRREDVQKHTRHRKEEPRERRGFVQTRSKARDDEPLRPEIVPDWNLVYVPILSSSVIELTKSQPHNRRVNVFHDIQEKMRAHKNKVNEGIANELEPMHQDAEKMYNHLAGHLTEKMLSQQKLMGNALEEQYGTLHAAKHRMSAERKKLQEAISQVREPYLKIQARKEEALARAMKMVAELEEMQAQNTEGPKLEWGQTIEKAKAKAEKLLDPAVLSAKFAKQRKYIFQEVGI